MVTNLAPAKPPTYVKVANFIGLYRHSRSGRYYACKKVKGVRKERSLETCDRKIAERRLKEWIGNLDKVDAEVEKMTIDTLMKRYVEVTAGLSESSRATDQSIIKRFWAWWPHGRDFEVRSVRPSMLDSWLAHEGQRLRNVSYNGYAGFVRELFSIAEKDRVVAESPAKNLRVSWKKPQPVERIVPTEAQFQAIINDIRTLPLMYPLTRYTEESADFLEFLGLAGLGQAEASSLKWGDIDWQGGRISFRRHKTDTSFKVPIYNHLRPLLLRLKERARGRAPASARVFKIKDAKKALAAACKRLKFPPFSQRSLRQGFILRLWRAGVDKKCIADWQGHQDGGQLIIDTYTEVFGDDDDAYEQMQLAKIGAGPVVPAPAGYSSDAYERAQLAKIGGAAVPAASVAQFSSEREAKTPSVTMKKRMNKARPRKPVAPAASVPTDDPVTPAPVPAVEPAAATAPVPVPDAPASLAPVGAVAEAPTGNPYKKGDRVKTQCKGQAVEAEVTAVFKNEVQVRTPDGELRWRTVRTVNQ